MRSIIQVLYLSIFSSGILQRPSCLDAYDRPHCKSWLARARDGVVDYIWPIASTQSSSCHKSPLRQSTPSSKLLARYGGDLVLRFKIQSAEEASALTEAVRVLLLDTWEFTSEWVDIRVSKDVVPSLLGLLPPSLQHAHSPLMHDLAQTIYESYPSFTIKDPFKPPNQPSNPFNPTLRSSTATTNVFFAQYQPLEVILPWMRLLGSLFPTHVRLITIGLSYEGREIQALRVGVHPTNADKPSDPRKTIIVAGGSHAREWIATSTVSYVAYSFITAYGRSKEITKLLEKFDFVLIPTINPDGYVYTWETDRLWRKNRQHTPLRFCQGLDLDRSFGYQWDSDPGENSPCSENFPGERSFEAVEARRLAEWAKNETQHNNVEFAGFLDFHSYSQQVLYPYSFSCTSTPPSLENLEELAIGIAKAIRTTSGEAYGVTSACEGSVPVAYRDGKPSSSAGLSKSGSVRPHVEARSGSAVDWFYHELKVPFAYQIKLRDTGTYGFLLPSENIVPTGKEAFKAVEYLGSFLAGNKGVEDITQGVHDQAKLTHPKDQRDREANEWMMVDKGDTDARLINGKPGELKRRRKR